MGTWSQGTPLRHRDNDVGDPEVETQGGVRQQLQGPLLSPRSLQGKPHIHQQRSKLQYGLWEGSEGITQPFGLSSMTDGGEVPKAKHGEKQLITISREKPNESKGSHVPYWAQAQEFFQEPQDANPTTLQWSPPSAG